MGFRQDINNFVGDLVTVLKEVSSQRAMREYGKFAAKLIVARTRNGFGVVKTGAKSKRLAKLAESTKERRRRSPNLSPFTTSGKSNLTFTGAMLDSIGVKSVSNQTVTIGANRRRRKGGVTNEDVAAFAEAGSSNRPKRQFLNLSSSELKQLTREFSNTFDKALKRSL